MQHYQFHIGDYAQATAHLSPLEDLAYRRLLDLYYSTETPISTDLNAVSRRIRMEVEPVEQVLAEFFQLSPEGYRHHRCDEELNAIYAKSDSARKSAELRWERERNANAMRTHSEGNPKAMLPVTRNPLPISKPKDLGADAPNPVLVPKEKKKQATPLPADFSITPEIEAWAKQHGFTRLQERLDHFRDWATAGAKRYADWDATFRNAVRGDWAHLAGQKVEAKSPAALRDFTGAGSAPAAPINREAAAKALAHIEQLRRDRA